MCPAANTMQRCALTHLHGAMLSQYNMDKFLVLHPKEDNVEAVLTKANVQNSKIGPFLAVILLGQKLPAVAPRVQPSAPTYFFGTCDSAGQFVDIAPNYTCVQAKKTAYLRLPSNVTLAFLDDSETEGEAEADRENGTKADILVTYHWPAAIAAQEKLSLVANLKLDDLVTRLQPRYHFSAGAGGRKHEALPFSWNSERSNRFISLAKEGSGEKWFYAFLLSNSTDEPKTGPNPFKRKREETELAPQKAAKVSERRLVTPMECFFCLANPNLESHMIVSIGEFSYVTIAKGPLTRPGPMAMAGHGIIIPIEHTPKVHESQVLEEISTFKRALTAMFAALSHDVVFFDFSRADNVHYHIQFVPVPRGVLGPDLTKFMAVLDDKMQYHNDNSRNAKLHFTKEDLKLDFLRFSICGEQETQLVSSLDGPVDLQFPRRVLAILLKVPKRIRWDRCRQTQGQEAQECDAFKRAFEKYDPTKVKAN